MYDFDTASAPSGGLSDCALRQRKGLCNPSTVKIEGNRLPIILNTWISHCNGPLEKNKRLVEGSV